MAPPSENSCFLSTHPVITFGICMYLLNWFTKSYLQEFALKSYEFLSKCSAVAISVCWVHHLYTTIGWWIILCILEAWNRFCLLLHLRPIIVPLKLPSHNDSLDICLDKVHGYQRLPNQLIQTHLVYLHKVKYLLYILGIQEKQLGDNWVCHIVFDWSSQHDDDTIFLEDVSICHMNVLHDLFTFVTAESFFSPSDFYFLVKRLDTGLLYLADQKDWNFSLFL